MFYGYNRIDDPVHLYKTARCLRNDLAMDCDYSNRIWSDDGSTALFDCSVWSIAHPQGALFTDFLYAHSSHGVPPNFRPKCINASSVSLL